MHEPFFSIIVPTFNRAGTIAATIDSVCTQATDDWELIVVDDASTDDTAPIVAPYVARDPRIRYVPLASNGGVNRARNAGIAVARGTWLVFQDSDDTFTPDAFTIFRSLIDRGVGDLIFTACRTRDGRVLSNQPTFEGHVSYAQYLRGAVTGEYNQAVRRSTFNRYLFMTDIHGGEGLTWAQLVRDAGRVYFSARVTRIYDDAGTDRLSVRSKNYARLAGVFRKDVRLFWWDYIRYAPTTLLVKSAKAVTYTVLALLRS